MDIRVWLGIGLVAFILIMIYDYKHKNKINKFLKNKKEIIDIFSKVFVAIITVFIALEANSISERQATDSRNETAPLFDILMTDELKGIGINEAYILENEKGLASYLKFNRIDKYYFTYLNYQVVLSIVVANDDEITSTISVDENQWYYIPIYQNMDIENISHLIESHVYEKTGKKISVASSRIYTVSFSDYKNEQFDFYFSYYNEDGVETTKLAYTDWESYHGSNVDNNQQSGAMIVKTENQNIENDVRVFVDRFIEDIELYSQYDL